MNRTAKPLPSQAYLHTILDYDPVTGIFTWKWRETMPLNWNRRRAYKHAGSIRDLGYIILGIDGEVYLAHRLAWVYVYGDVLGPTDDVDHKNTISGDNRIDNLRPATPSQNMANRKPNKGRDLPKGVHRSGDRFRAIIRITGRNVNLGFYATIEEAKSAYATALINRHGDFARIQ